jgi:hypothetical protein
MVWTLSLSRSSLQILCMIGSDHTYYDSGTNPVFWPMMHCEWKTKERFNKTPTRLCLHKIWSERYLYGFSLLLCSLVRENPCVPSLVNDLERIFSRYDLSPNGCCCIHPVDVSRKICSTSQRANPGSNVYQGKALLETMLAVEVDFFKKHML